MSLSGRLVPWISWEEWEQVGRYLFDENESIVRKGLDIVAAWRIRGRVPVGVDATANLRETQLNDSGMSDHLTRLQYSISIVRFVNGVADSAQKGRVAVSVASLAQNVGIPRILVDIRHESTHNELPSLSTLRIAAHQALTWLRQRYWTAQKTHILQSKQKIWTVFHQYVESHILAASREDSAVNDTIEYDVRKAKKERQALLTELRSKVPGGAEDILVEAAAQQQTLSVNNRDDCNNKAVIVGCGRALKHIVDAWGNIPSLLVQDYMQNLFQSMTGTLSARNQVWFEVALDGVDTAVLISLLRECIIKHADGVYKKHMVLFINMATDTDFEHSVDLLKSACDACMGKLYDTDSGFLQEFISLFLAQPVSQDLLERMKVYIDAIQPKEEKRRKGWVKVEEWTPCAIGMVPCSYNTNGILPNIFVPERNLSERGPFDAQEEDIPQQQEDDGMQQQEEQSESLSTGIIDESDGVCLPPSASFFHAKGNA